MLLISIACLAQLRVLGNVCLLIAIYLEAFCGWIALVMMPPPA
jgi:hypothetical protein